MSGGSYDYLCYKMEDAARTLMRQGQPSYRQAFGQLMFRCANAMHDVEWVDSSDKGPGDDLESIMKCISDDEVLKVTVEQAEKTLKELDRLIKLAKKK